MYVSANLWVTNARSGRNLHEPRADGGRADQPRRTRLRYFFSPLEGAHHLRHRSGRGRHVDAHGRAASVSRGGKSEEGNLDVHQLARWRGDVGPCDLRYDAIHSPTRIDTLHRTGGIDGLVAA